MKTVIKTIDEYLATFPPEVRVALKQLREFISKLAPEATEKISYGIPTFFLNGNLIHFAGYEHHIGLYPGAGAIAEFKDELKTYETSKGTIRLPIDKPLPFDLISKIIKACVKRNLERVKN